ncbi:THO complex subunit 4C isoform X1 [Eutrema salsugineum]|uniref:THO complex subunit 4C isoform X1 n=1 Tax=Eutrema salsugineum TaxID=72664 RepID=UPI000CED0711|nr:THO complex subunit 4C isoform X1 [Eutrema salsugineum]
MSESLNMTLDEIVKRSKTAARSGAKGISRRGRGGRGANGFLGAGRGAGPVRKGPLALKVRPSSSFSINKLARRKRSLPWQNELFEDSLRAVGVSGMEVGTTVYVTNLDQGVTNDDIRELFGEIGEMKRYAIHFDQNGRPNGSAEVVYMRRSDAFQAMKRYNNVLLDGRSMKLEIQDGNTNAAPIAARVNVTGLNGRMKRTVSIGYAVTISWSIYLQENKLNVLNLLMINDSCRQGIRGGRGKGRGRSAATSVRRLPIQNQQGGLRGGRGRGRGQGGGGGRGSKSGRGRKKPVEKSAAELDKDLESYHAEAMNIS